jgi:hypothetical protein
MERFRGSGKNGKRKCRYCDERARWRVRDGWRRYYACHEHKDKLPPQKMQDIRDDHITEGDRQSWMRV